MAEQTSHNVVINSESAGASAPVDAAANKSTTSSALSGKINNDSTLDTSKAAPPSDSPIQINGTTDGNVGLDAPPVAAEPSAGEAAGREAFKPADAKTISDNEKTGQANGDLANGVHDDNSQLDAHPDDKSTAGASVDLSVNSDTDNSKADAGEKGAHARTSSTVKKPTAFSKVNATKSFMSKIAPSAPSAPQVGDKSASASAILQPANRPRLIAKTGSSQSMLKPRTGAAGSGAPDASKVWNKNQPVAAPPPKQLTDEELKQQFGIHLATRLQTDGDKKDSNWADIDDDEDDWAPETVVWMDGTKSTVPKDATPTPAEEEKKPAAQPVTKPAEGVKPTLSVKQRSDRAEHPMRILKPGAAATQSKQNGAASAASSTTAKSALTSKSPAPAPAKSPWAPVPKPDSVAPINPPVQVPAPQRILPSQDARASEPMGSAPAREIAADTFDRSWQSRDGAARELFNSTNGLYEPVPEGRRGSMRQDNARKPAVLQRPSQALSPAPEPSSAFQSRSSSQMDGSWSSRRRGSSVSQGSMPPPRRMSMNKSSEFGATPKMPGDSARADAARPNFNQASAWDKQMPPPPHKVQEPEAPQGEPMPPPEDPVKIQERIMHEKREAAKRRKEEEAREEAERKERLKAKLAALEGAGKSRSERAAEAAAKATEKNTDKPVEAAKSTVAQDTPPAKSPAPDNASTQKPVILETPTVQQPQAEKVMPPPEPETPLTGLASREEQGRSQTAARTGPSRAPFAQQQTVNYRAPASSYSSPGERKSQPAQLGRSPVANNDAFSPWPTTTSSNNNIWGSGFGNGVFEGGSAFAPMATSQQNSSLPPPPGMSRVPGSARISPQGFNPDTRSPNLGQPQLTEQQRSFPAPGMTDRSVPFGPAQPRLTGVSPQHAPGYGRPHHPPGPIGPPSRAQNQGQQGQVQQPSQPPEIAAWKVAAESLHQQYQSAPTGANAPTANGPIPDHRFKETFKKTSAEQGKLGGPRRYDSVEHTIHDGSGSRTVSSFSPAPPSTQTQPIAPAPGTSPAHGLRANAANNNTVRIPDPSQNPTHAGLPRPIEPPHRRHAERLQQLHNSANAAKPLAPNVSSKEQFAPPPEIESHPVYEGNARHPQVRLPKPQAKVRLPPPSPSATSPQMQSRHNGSVVMPPQRHSFRQPLLGAVQPIVANAQWQQRFNGLFGRADVQNEAPPSPPKTPPKAQGPSLAVASSSIEPMATQTGGATVSLPQGNKTPLGLVTSEPTSKPAIDFSDERSFGSLPVVKVPRSPRYAPHTGAAHSHNMLKMPPPHKYAKMIETGYREPMFFWRNPAGIFVKIPYTALNNRLCYAANHGSNALRPARGERKQPFQPRNQQAPSPEQEQPGVQQRKQHRVEGPIPSGTGPRKPSHAVKGQQPASQNTEDRKSSGKFANKKFEDRRTTAPDVAPAAAPPKTPSGPSSKRSSMHVNKDQKPSTPPPAKTTPMSAKEATTEKRKSGVSKPLGTPSASANRFDLLAAMGSPSKN